jgi:hypothetical protein
VTVHEMIKRIRSGRAPIATGGCAASTGPRAAIQACPVGRRAYGEECDRHAEQHDHCRVCAGACRGCEQACNDLLAPTG